MVETLPTEYRARMADTSDGPQEHRNPTPVDWAEPDHVLTLLAHLASEVGLEFSVRLFTGSGVLSGTLIGGKQYFDQLTSLTRPDGSAEPPPESSVAGFFTLMSEWYQDAASKEEDVPVAYAHLRSAWLFSPGQQPLEVGLWRGRLTSISGWSVGQYDVPEPGTAG